MTGSFEARSHSKCVFINCPSTGNGDIWCNLPRLTRQRPGSQQESRSQCPTLPIQVRSPGTRNWASRATELLDRKPYTKQFPPGEKQTPLLQAERESLLETASGMTIVTSNLNYPISRKVRRERMNPSPHGWHGRPTCLPCASHRPSARPRVIPQASSWGGCSPEGWPLS